MQGELPFLSLVTSYKLIIRKSQHLFRNSNFPTSTPSLSKQDINISLFRVGKILNIIIHSTPFALSAWLQSPSQFFITNWRLPLFGQTGTPSGDRRL